MSETLYVDYSEQYSDTLLDQIKAAGYKGIIRYVPYQYPDGSWNPKGCTKQELIDATAKGLQVILVFESTGGRAQMGAIAGKNDVIMAESNCIAINYTGVIFYADDANTNWGTVIEYFQGVRENAKHFPVGVYGGIDVIEGAHSAGFIWLWQTSAWSRNLVSPHANIYQRLTPTVANPVPNTDENIIITSVPSTDGNVSIPTPPVHPVNVAPAFPLNALQYFGYRDGGANSISGFFSHSDDLKNWQQRMFDRGWKKMAIDGKYGDITHGICVEFQGEKGLSIDGKIGPITWADAWILPIT